MRTGAIIVRAALLLFVGWLYGGDLVWALRARDAEVSALTEAPRLGLAVAGVALALAGVVLLARALQQKRPAHWRPQRLVTLALLGLVGLDFVVLSAGRASLPAEEQALLALQSMSETASELSGAEAVLRDPQALEAMAGELGPVPYLERGERVKAWAVEVRERCSGPAGDERAARPGTFIYCVSTDRHTAWVTLVGTKAGERFGPRAVVSTEPAWVGEVRAAPQAEGPPDQPEPTPEAPVWDSPTPGDPP